MARRARKRLFDLLRIVASIAALWIVLQGVTLDDHVVLKHDGSDVVGLVVFPEGTADHIEVHNSDGQVTSLAVSDIAVDADGAPRIEYGLKTAWRNSRKPLFVLSFGITFLVVFPLALRFQWLLRVQGIHVGYWESLKLSFAGNFLNFATPFGSNMGDVFKAYFVSLHTEHKTEAVATVALDRFIGLGTLIAVASTITIFSPSGSRLAELRPYTLGLLLLGVLAIIAYLSPVLRRYVLPRTWLAKLPMFEQIQRVDQAARLLARRKSIVSLAILLTLTLQWLSLGGAFTIAVALGLDAHAGNIVEYYAYFYAGALVQALPGPPQGLGTVELAYRYLLAPFGSASQIVCVAFDIRIVVLACALPGLLVTLTGSYKPRVAAHLRESDDAPPDDETGTVHGLATSSTPPGTSSS